MCDTYQNKNPPTYAEGLLLTQKIKNGTTLKHSLHLLLPEPEQL